MDRLRSLLATLLLCTSMGVAAQAPVGATAPPADTSPHRLTDAVRDLVRTDRGHKGEGMARWVLQQAGKRLRVHVRRSGA